MQKTQNRSHVLSAFNDNFKKIYSLSKRFRNNLNPLFYRGKNSNQDDAEYFIVWGVLVILYMSVFIIEL